MCGKKSRSLAHARSMYRASASALAGRNSGTFGGLTAQPPGAPHSGASFFVSVLERSLRSTKRSLTKIRCSRQRERRTKEKGRRASPIESSPRWTTRPTRKRMLSNVYAKPLCRENNRIGSTRSLCK